MVVMIIITGIRYPMLLFYGCPCLRSGSSAAAAAASGGGACVCGSDY